MNKDPLSTTCYRMSMRSNRLVSGRARSKLRIAQKVRRQLTAAHSSDLLPLLPSGPGGVHRVRCAGPAPDLLHHTIPHRLTGALYTPSATVLDAKIKRFHACETRFCSPARPAGECACVPESWLRQPGLSQEPGR